MPGTTIARFVPPDPLQFVYRYSDRRDVEIVAFLASSLAYGRVQQIERSLTQLFDRMDDSPYEFVSRFDGRGRARLRSFKHRFTTGDDIWPICWSCFDASSTTSAASKRSSCRATATEHATVLPALSAFCDSLCGWTRTCTDGHGLPPD